MGVLAMFRDDVLRNYRVDGEGIIRSPGKFEAESVYVPYFWNKYLNGFADEDEGGVLGFKVTSGDRAEFPELGPDDTTVYLWERDDGFVCELSEKEAENMRADHVEDDDE
jgi:hypothetical protein